MELETSVVINQPVQAVFAFVSHYANDSQWIAGRVAEHVVSPGPPAVGSTFQTPSKFLAWGFDSTMEVTAYEANHQICAKAVRGPVAFTDCRLVEPAGAATKVTLRLEAGSIHGLFKLADPIALARGRRQRETDIAPLKDLLKALVAAAR